mgnify:FL=1|jgi:hypothetical protein
MTYMVSPCCGAEYSDYQDDEGCDVYTCDAHLCKEIFTEPIEDYEFSDRMKESRAEMEADERRDMGQ